MQIAEYIAKQLPERQNLLSKIHEIIIENDKTVKATVGPMMGKDMIMYCAPGSFKYGLASVKNYISLHLLPMYGSPTIYNKYKTLLKHASFQKGCINFNSAKEMPFTIVKKLLKDCSKIDLQKIREEYLQSKKEKKKK